MSDFPFAEKLLLIHPRGASTPKGVLLHFVTPVPYIHLIS